MIQQWLADNINKMRYEISIHVQIKLLKLLSPTILKKNSIIKLICMYDVVVQIRICSTVWILYKEVNEHFWAFMLYLILILVEYCWISYMCSCSI